MIQRSWKRVVKMCVCFSVVLSGAMKNGVAALTSKADFKESRGDRRLNKASSILRWDKLIQAQLLDNILLLTNKITLSSIYKKTGACFTRGTLFYQWKMNRHEHDHLRISRGNKSNVRGATTIYRNVRSPPTWLWLANSESLGKNGRDPPTEQWGQTPNPT